jgi:hypothetical protein
VAPKYRATSPLHCRRQETRSRNCWQLHQSMESKLESNTMTEDTLDVLRQYEDQVNDGHSAEQDVADNLAINLRNN